MGLRRERRREAPDAHPPARRDTSLRGRYNPITLEYQINPPAHDTLVTGMGGGADVDGGTDAVPPEAAVREA